MFIGQLDNGRAKTKSWTIDVYVNDVKVKFAIDTGADESIIPESMYNKLNLNTSLSKTDKVLHGANKSKLECMGKVDVDFRANNRSSNQSMYVVKDCTTALLGKPAIEALDVVRIVNNVEVEKHHPKLFSGLGVMKGEYNIKLAEGYVPHAVNAPRKIASVPLYKIIKESSKLLTTFITPFGRFAYSRMPFGITSAPEHAQKRLAQLLDDLEGVEVFIDDILIHAPNQDLHDARLGEVLNRLDKAGMTLNKAKCEISKKSIQFVGHIVSDNGILPDPEKTKALRDMPRPENIHDVRRFLGIVNQFSKFSPKLSDLSQPIRELLQKDKQWVWNEPQERSFNEIKLECLSGTCLALFDPNLETKVASDASKRGLGACLYQRQQGGEWRLVFCASRIIIPSSLRLEVLDFIHEGHQGIVKCRERAKQSVWWPGISSQIGDLVYKCHTCAHQAREVKEPMMPSQFPSRPWERVAADLYYLQDSTYLLVVDYYSRYIEVAKLTSTSKSSDIIMHLQSMFSRHGIPDVFRSDNGPQFISSEFKAFSKKYGFTHITSSPLYSQSNGEAERAVQTVKGLIKKSKILSSTYGIQSYSPSKRV
ncbi:hypothetical protein BSL78_25470 [Apostichopus japonicus]|uniref:Endonuclease n=1 Tax=Stichopus japonicus TaxID=307972 RepID=A0A2G8JPR4_STIJA|nr:hypothetical protein BSL78_25470 [Apostichopus japonicus]